MFLSLKCKKDTTLYNAKIRGVNRSGSNVGASEIMELFVLTSSASMRGVSRSLLYFDIEDLSSSIASGDFKEDRAVYKLIMKSADHYETTPSSFEIQVSPVERFWHEGRGLSMYDEGLADKGFANWGESQQGVSWTIPGGDYSSVILTQSFDDGFEDLEVDITSIVNSWLTGGVENHGLIVKFTDFYETGSNDLYIKKFYSRHSRVPFRQPSVFCYSDTSRYDDRKNVKFNISASLYYYRDINGEFSSVGQNMSVDIFESGSLVIEGLEAHEVQPGIYSASFVIPSASSSAGIFQDVWYVSGSSQYYTGSFVPKYETGSISVNVLDLDFDIINLKPEYYSKEEAIVRVFARQKDYKTATRLTASVEKDPVFLKNVYCSIEHDDSRQIMIPFEHNKLSYDKNGNYFTLNINSFPFENIYRIKIKAEFNNQTVVFDKDWKFKVKNSH